MEHGHTIEFVNDKGEHVLLQKVVYGPGYFQEDSEWIATGSIEMRFGTLNSAWGRLSRLGFDKKRK